MPPAPTKPSRSSIRPDLAEADICLAQGGALARGSALALPVAAALARELVHAAVGIHAGKGPAFRKVALGIGLTGPMRATRPGPAFLALIAPILDAAGPLPHARLQADRSPDAADPDDADAPATTRPRTQASRHIKCARPACGYLVRTARQWLDQIGPPLCPRHGPMLPEGGAIAAPAASNGAAPTMPPAFSLTSPA